MYDEFSQAEVITGVARRRRFSTEQKLAIVAETMQPGQSISYVAAIARSGDALLGVQFRQQARSTGHFKSSASALSSRQAEGWFT